MNKIILRSLTAIQLFLLTGTVALEYLCGKYMTMMRIMLYKNRMLEAAVNMDTATTVTAYILLALCAFYGRILFSDSPSTRRASIIIMILLAGGTALFTLTNDPSSLRTYYAAFFLLTGVTVVQMIRLSLQRKN